MDVIRTCYRTKMRTTTLAPPVEVQWYFTPPGAPKFTEPSVFRSRVWKDINEFANTGMGEQSEVCCNRKVLEYSNGNKPVGLTTGEHPCGSDEVARNGGGPDDPIFATRADGGAPCCLGPPAFTSVIHGGFGADGTFHGNGAPPSADQLINWTLIPPFLTGLTEATGGDFTVFNDALPGGQVLFQFTDLGTHWTLSLVFIVAMDFWQIETWGLRYLAVRFKATGGTAQDMTLIWPNP